MLPFTFSVWHAGYYFLLLKVERMFRFKKKKKHRIEIEYMPYT